MGEMAIEHHDREGLSGDLRDRQEREIALGHSLASAEHVLAQEAFALGRTFERAGISFDPLTFVVMRIVEGSGDENIDPVECLELLAQFGFLERSVALANDLLDEAA
jgi:hypothetical protein